MDHRLILPPNTVLDGSYRILRVVGSGGFGVTYEAEDSNLGTSFAIKEYYPIDFADRDARMHVRPKSERHNHTFDWGRANFLHEARTLARFEHQSIVRVVRVFEANSTAYMVMRFEQGQSFEAWLNKLGRPPAQQELDAILAPLLDALEMMHAAEFLHRDIAPDNIIIRTDGTPVLLDFGAARRAFAEVSLSPGGVIKAGYSPPEQYSFDGRLQGPWSDLYALGATLYRAVAGRPPEEATLRVDKDEMPPATEAAKGDYRQEFLAALDGCLKVRHSERPLSVAQLRPILLGRRPEPANGSIDEAKGATGRILQRRSGLQPRSFSRRLAAGVMLVASGGLFAALEFTPWRAEERAEEIGAGSQESASITRGERELALKRQRADEERAAREAEEARNGEAERKAELEAQGRQNRDKAAAAEAEMKRLAEYAALVKGLQAALSRVGCYAGDANGRWNTRERAALDQFAKLAKLDLRTDEPTSAALYAVVAHKERVCPLKCGDGTMERSGVCVPKVVRVVPRPKAPSVGAAAGEERSRAAQGGYVTCGRNGCQVVPRGCYAIRGGGGGGLGGRIVCP